MKDLDGISSSEIEAQRSGYCSYGCKWTIHFIGEKQEFDIRKSGSQLGYDPMNIPSINLKHL